MQVVLLSTYDLGHQPFGLASPAAWLLAGGHSVTCADLSLESLPEQAIRAAGLIAFYLPMHTATRLAIPAIQRVRTLNPAATLCCYGLYGPLNGTYLSELGVSTVLNGEFEADLLRLANGTYQQSPAAAPERLHFEVPDRTGLLPLDRYAQLHSNGGTRLSGYTEASRGCKHLCRHCPIVPVYQGTFRVVQREVVLQDIRGQIAMGARHITFGDPDFLNGPSHAMRIVDALHSEFPEVTYDATIKIEHLRRHRHLLPELRRTGCAFVTSAVESFDDEVLWKLAKGHTMDDVVAVLREFREIGLPLVPTFIAFTPWTTPASYRRFLQHLLELELTEAVSSVQLALRLLIPAGSPMLELDDVRAVLQGFDAPRLLHRWKHPDPEVDRLAAAALKIAGSKGSRAGIFARIWELAQNPRLPDDFQLIPRAAVPYLNEPWYC